MNFVMLKEQKLCPLSKYFIADPVSSENSIKKCWKNWPNYLPNLMITKSIATGD